MVMGKDKAFPLPVAGQEVSSASFEQLFTITFFLLDSWCRNKILSNVRKVLPEEAERVYDPMALLSWFREGRI